MIRPSRSSIIAAAVTLLYAALATYKVLHHVFWEDEWQMWLTARSQNSALDVAMCSRYDGHPPLWYLIQYVITRFSHDIIWLKLLHVGIASGCVYVIWRYSPFTLLEKILLPLGYFFFFEYSTISRCYAPGVLLALVAMAMFPTAKRRPIAMGGVLFFIGQFSLFGMVLSLAIALALAVDWLGDRPTIGWRERPARWWAVPVWMIGSLVLFYVCTKLPPDAVGVELWVNGWKSAEPLAAGAHLFDAYVPVPQFTQHWWNTQLLPIGDAGRAALGAIILVIAAIIVRKSRAALALLLSGSFITLGLMTFVYTGAMRHWGHLFILFVLAVWIARVTTAATKAREADQPRRSWEWYAVDALLVIQVFAGMVASIFDLSQPFSTTPAAARILNQLGPNLPIAGDYDNVMNALAGELNRPVYFLRSGEFRWFTRFDTRRRNPDYDLLDAEVKYLANRFHSDVLLVLTYSIPLPGYFEPVVDVPPGTVEVEKFYIYRYRYRPGT